jgi:hypothetical protein
VRVVDEMLEIGVDLLLMPLRKMSTIFILWMLTCLP